MKPHYNSLHDKSLAIKVKGDLSCKMHFGTSFIHEYVSPVCQGTHQVSENTTLSLFLHTQISKNGAATDLMQTDPDLKLF